MRRFLGALALLIAPTALADGDESVRQARESLSLREAAEELKGRCGVAPPVSIDWRSFPADYGNDSVSGYCGSALSALGTHCEGKAKRALIQKKLKGLTCRFGGKGKRALAVEKGTIVVTLDFEASNYDEWARKELLRSF